MKRSTLIILIVIIIIVAIIIYLRFFRVSDECKALKLASEDYKTGIQQIETDCADVPSASTEAFGLDEYLQALKTTSADLETKLENTAACNLAAKELGKVGIDELSSIIKNAAIMMKSVCSNMIMT